MGSHGSSGPMDIITPREGYWGSDTTLNLSGDVVIVRSRDVYLVFSYLMITKLVWVFTQSLLEDQNVVYNKPEASVSDA